MEVDKMESLRRALMNLLWEQTTDAQGKIDRIMSHLAWEIGSDGSSSVNPPLNLSQLLDLAREVRHWKKTEYCNPRAADRDDREVNVRYGMEYRGKGCRNHRININVHAVEDDEGLVEIYTICAKTPDGPLSIYNPRLDGLQVFNSRNLDGREKIYLRDQKNKVDQLEVERFQKLVGLLEHEYTGKS